MALENDGTLSTEAQIIRNETEPKANTAIRVGDHLLNLITSKVNWTQVDPDTTLTANSDSRTVSQKAVKAYVDARTGGAKKIYRALITQSGTGAPTATILENTLGASIVWTRTGAGLYVGTLAAAFTVNKTFIPLPSRLVTASGSDFTEFELLRNDANTVYVYSRFGPNGTAAYTDGLLANYPIEILVYP